MILWETCQMNNIEIFIIINAIVFFTGMFVGIMMMTLDKKVFFGIIKP